MIVIFVYLTPNFQELADVTMPPLRKYCEQHGYRLVIHMDEKHQDDPRPFGFRKTEAALTELQRLPYGTGILCVMDADILITNHSIKLESFLDLEHDMWATHDVNGFNSGIYLIRATRGTAKLLEDAISRSSNIGVHGEQDALRDTLRLIGFRDLLKIVPHPSFNSYLYTEYGLTMEHHQGQWEKGDFCLHLPGRENSRRIEIFTSPEIQEEIVW